MRSKQAIGSEIEGVQAVKGMVESFEEMAANKMQAIRGGITTSRAYFRGLSRLSQEVGIDLSEGIGEERLVEAVVLFSANRGMFGELIAEVAEDFVKYAKRSKGDIFVVGRVGAEIVRKLVPELRFEYLEMADGEVEREVMNEMVKRLSDYREVKLYYGEFRNLVKQESTVRSLSGEFSLEHLPKEAREVVKTKLKYLYEPGPSEIAQVFAREVFANVMEETVREGQLAKYASRLMYLDGVVEGIDKRVGSLEKEKRKVRKRSNGKKQNLRTVTVKAQTARKKRK